MKNAKAIQKTVQEFINKSMELRKQRDELFRGLQKRAEERGWSKWCSFDMLIEDIETVDKIRAEKLRKKVAKMDIEISLIDEFGSKLANAGFWKQG